MRACVVYATTSGSTRVVASLIAEAWGGADLADLADLASDYWLHLRGYDLLFLGTPTYGTGDWHYLWERYAGALADGLLPRHLTALFALGDARGHAGSFAGGIGKLQRFRRGKAVDVSAPSPASDFLFRSSPALEGSNFPGLVLEYRRNHRKAPALVGNWVRRVRERVEAVQLLEA